MSWRDAKIAALQGRVYTDYREGMRYDGGHIPTSNIVQGYGDQNRSHLNMNYWHETDINLPENPQELYEGCADYSSGFTRWSQQEAQIELAPLFVNWKMPQVGLVGSCLSGARVNEPFFAMPGTNEQITHVPMTIHDVGNPIGTLTIGPEHPKQNLPVAFRFYQ